jgi:hypothetical protein
VVWACRSVLPSISDKSTVNSPIFPGTGPEQPLVPPSDRFRGTRLGVRDLGRCRRLAVVRCLGKPPQRDTGKVGCQPGAAYLIATSQNPNSNHGLAFPIHKLYCSPVFLAVT